MPHVRESEPRPDDAESRDQADPSAQLPPSKLGGRPFNPDETVPEDQAPDPGGRTEKDRQPDPGEGRPGNDL